MASFSDKNIKGITITIICLYAVVLIAGITMHQLLLYVAIINAFACVLVIGYWIWDKKRFLNRPTEKRESVVVLGEGLFLITAVYALVASSLPHWLAIVQYAIYAIHFLLLIAFLIFMLTFKIKKLF